ncbi:hypothetical protein FACS189476_08270 [Spirochaetia bacterium]|nr:hypothetical protein FACS189476_08270 [Spirochaetia bacterium]
MKKSRIAVIAALLLLAAGAGFAQEAGGFETAVIGGTITITKYTGSAAKVRIPKRIDGLPVTAIGALAFYECTGITSVSIPASVTSIGFKAFKGCENLKSINIPDGVTVIESETFGDCYSLASVSIPRSVAGIDSHAFYNCRALASITLSDNVTYLGEMVFVGCTGLASIIIPDSVTILRTAVFADCTGLTSITIPETVSVIRDEVFSGCTGLTSITIPAGVTYIGELAFLDCTGLTSITIPDSVLYIGDRAFNHCRNLTSVSRSKDTELGDNVFADTAIGPANKAVTNFAWVDAEGNALGEAHIEDTVYAFADVNGAHIPDGTEVSVIIFEYNEDEDMPDDYVTQLSATVQDGAIRAAWEAAYDEDQTNTQCVREIEDKGYTIPRYRFHVRYTADDGETYRSAFSAPMTAWGSANLQMWDEENDTGMANIPFILHLADGTECKVVTDDEGYIRAFRLPLGYSTISLDTDYFNYDNSDSVSDDDSDTAHDLDTDISKALLRVSAFTPSEKYLAAIAAGADVNARDLTGMTPLMYAAHYGKIDAIRALLDAGADVNASDNFGITSLMKAAGTGDLDVIQILLDAGADITAQDRFRHTSVTDVNETAPAYALLRAVALAAGMTMEEDDSDNTAAFLLLCATGTAEEIRAAIDAGADVAARDSIGQTALIFAAVYNDAGAVRVLLDAGADVNEQCDSGEMTPMSGATPLMAASLKVTRR